MGRHFSTQTLRASALTSLQSETHESVYVAAHAVDLVTGDVLFALNEQVVMPGVSLGRLLLLAEVAARLQRDPLSGLDRMDRFGEKSTHSSGLWRSMDASLLSVHDLAALVGATNDSLAVHVLLRRVGFAAVHARAEAEGMNNATLLDLARDHEATDDAHSLGTSSVTDLTTFFSSLALGRIDNVATSRQVIEWLSLNSDLSLVSSAFGLDPHIHPHTQRGITLVNATSAVRGVLSEAGLVQGKHATVAFAVSAYGDDDDLPTRLAVIDAMRTLGVNLLEYVY